MTITAAMDSAVGRRRTFAIISHPHKLSEDNQRQARSYFLEFAYFYSTSGYLRVSP
jgi:hypothetical protein